MRGTARAPRSVGTPAWPPRSGGWPGRCCRSGRTAPGPRRGRQIGRANPWLSSNSLSHGCSIRARGCECFHERALHSDKESVARQPLAPSFWAFSMVSFVTGPEEPPPAVHPAVGASGTPRLGGVRDASDRTPPSPLVVAASLVAVEGLLLLAYGVLEAANVHADRVAMGVTTAAFLAALGLMLV